MKTAISVPDRIFARAEKAARRLGISRSQFFAKAAERWADELDRSEITDQLNAAMATESEDENLEFLRAAGERAIESSGAE